MFAITKRGKLVKERRRLEILVSEIQNEIEIHERSCQIASQNERGLKSINAIKVIILECRIEQKQASGRIASIKGELSPHLA